MFESIIWHAYLNDKDVMTHTESISYVYRNGLNWIVWFQPRSISMVPPYIGLLNERVDKTRPDGIIFTYVSIWVDISIDFDETTFVIVALKTNLYKP